MIRRAALAALMPLPLWGCPLIATFGLSTGGGAVGALATAHLAETDADLAIRLSEDGACLVEAKDQEAGEKVSALAAELCRALQLAHGKVNR